MVGMIAQRTMLGATSILTGLLLLYLAVSSTADSPRTGGGSAHVLADDTYTFASGWNLISIHYNNAQANIIIPTTTTSTTSTSTTTSSTTSTSTSVTTTIGCPDLAVSYISTYGSSRWFDSTCSEGSCETDCFVNLPVKFKISNWGSSNAGASTSRVEVTPSLGSKNASIGALASGETSNITNLLFQTSDSTVGPEEGDTACATSFSWWDTNYTTFTITVYADITDVVGECNEANNNATSVMNITNL